MHVHVAGGWGVFRIEGYSDLGSWNIHACTCSWGGGGLQDILTSGVLGNM